MTDEDAFRVDADCCLQCGVPELIAPELFEFGPGGGCRMRRQPANDEELGRMLEVLASQEVDCIAYHGHDPAILQRMGEAGLADYASDPAAARFATVVRDHLSFVWRPPPGEPATLRKLANRLRAWLREKAHFTVLPASPLAPSVVSFSWYGFEFHRVRFAHRHDGRFVAAAEPWDPAWQGVARTLADWLKVLPGAGPPAWHTAAGWKAGEPGAPHWR